ncbi:RNA-directed DNA polymerase, eukaryota [Tanacetum coccineum]
MHLAVNKKSLLVLYYSLSYDISNSSFDQQKGKKVRSVTIVPSADRWNWNLESTGIFSVASARRRIDEICLPNIGEETRWVKCVPIKINVLAWKIKTDALPTRFNISRRGIDIQDMSCPICDNAIESTDHLFFRCGLVRDIANKVLSWWNLDHANLNSYAEWKSWLVSIRMDSKLKKMFEGVWYSIWWYVWIYRNKLLFDERKPSKSMLIDNVIMDYVLPSLIMLNLLSKVRIGERKVREGEVPLLELTRGRVVSLTSINDQRDVNIQDCSYIDEVPAIVAEKTKGSKNKRKATRGASGSILPSKKRDDYGTSRVGASTGGKFLVAFQSLLEGSTLAVEVGVAATTTVPFVTSSVTLTSECEGSLLLFRGLGSDEPVHASIYFTIPPPHGRYDQGYARPSQPAGTELSSALDDPDVCRSLVDQLALEIALLLAPPVLFSQLCGMDYDQLFAEFNVRAARQTCLSAEVRMRTEHILREKKRLEGRCSRQSDLLKEKDAEIASLKAQLSLNKAEAAEAIHLRGQVATVEAAERPLGQASWMV